MIYFPFIKKSCWFDLWDVICDPKIVERTGDWLMYAEYVETYVEDFRWIDTVWAHMLYNLTNDQLTDLFVEEWFFRLPKGHPSIVCLESWFDTTHPWQRPGFDGVWRYDGGLSGLFD